MIILLIKINTSPLIINAYDYSNSLKLIGLIDKSTINLLND